MIREYLARQPRDANGRGDRCSTNSPGVGRLGLLASAISRRPLQVEPAEAGEPTWTDGRVVYVDVRASAR